nr:protein kinase [Planctomycetota bacterium]
MINHETGTQPRNDTDLVRYAVRIGLVAADVAEQALARFSADGTAALTDLVARGALDRDRVLALRDGQFDFLDRLGTYRLFEVLGHGGMGVVYRAHDERGGEAAVKVLSPHLALDRVYQQRFLRETQAASAVTSPFVVRCHGGGSGDGRYWIAMELMRGGNAEDAAERERGRLPPERCLRLMRDAAEGLEAIHAAGLVHRDIKPANLFLTEDGRAKLGDFGIARLPEDDGATRLTAIGRTLGTPGFMAPEQASALPDLDIRADIYGIGATLYCLLTGQAPFIGSSNWLVMSQALAKPLPDPRDLTPECPPAVAAIVRGCGALRREDRYLTPALLRADIERVLAGEAPRHLPVAAMAAIATAQSAKPAASAAARERRILIVDDDPLLTRIHESKFTSAGWVVSVAHDGATALASVASFAPTIMLLDLVLPGLDGPEVIRRLRRDPAQAQLPIVVLSNAYFADELRAAREAGADLILS